MQNIQLIDLITQLVHLADAGDAKIKGLEERNAKLMNLLVELEHPVVNGDGYQECYFCSGTELIPHNPNCRWIKVVGENIKQPVEYKNA